MKDEVCVAAVQIVPLHFDRDATITKVIEFIQRAAKDGAELVVFPECTVPMYPVFPTTENLESANGRGWVDYWNQMLEESVEIPGPAAKALGEAARAASVYVVIGVNEREDGPGGPRLFNSALVFSSSGELVGCHRKTLPVLHERLYHDPGMSSDIAVFQTELGRIGVGTCFENLHPFYRYALLAQGEEIHCALWVSVPEDRHLMPVSAQQHAAEGGVFVVAVGQTGPINPFSNSDEQSMRSFVGGSFIVAPGGRQLTEPVIGHEEIVQARLERRLLGESHLGFHLLGKDARRDLYDFALLQRGSDGLATRRVA